jgi:predicted flap endonuclease-1-like 5' DNA nuclease
VIQIVKKKEVEQRDPHVREAYIAEGHERYTPTPTPISTTPIPNQPIAPIPIATPRSIEQLSIPRNELITINGINEKTALQLEKLGINNIDDLAKASAEKLAKNLKVDLHAVQKWISTAKKLQQYAKFNKFDNR